MASRVCAIFHLEQKQGDQPLSSTIQTMEMGKAMRKKIISGFSCFAKDETNFFSYSNLISIVSCLRKFCETNVVQNPVLECA